MAESDELKELKGQITSLKGRLTRLERDRDELKERQDRALLIEGIITPDMERSETVVTFMRKVVLMGLLTKDEARALFRRVVRPDGYLLSRFDAVVLDRRE